MVLMLFCMWVTLPSIWAASPSNDSLYAMPYLPTNITAMKIEYQPYKPRGLKPSLDRLLEGQTVETLDEVILQNLLNLSAVCDISRYRVLNREVVFTPSICSPDCEAPDTQDYYTYKACENRPYLRNIRAGVCCPASKIPWFKERFPNNTLYEWRELYGVRFHENIDFTTLARNRNSSSKNRRDIIDPPDLPEDDDHGPDDDDVVIDPPKKGGPYSPPRTSTSRPTKRTTKATVRTTKATVRTTKATVRTTKATLRTTKATVRTTKATTTPTTVTTITSVPRPAKPKYKWFEDPEFKNRFKTDIVCGVRPNDAIKFSQRQFHVFICVEGFQCADKSLEAKSPLRAVEGWHEFCETASPSPHCCHIELLPQDYYDVDNRPTSWTLPGLPFHTNYVPGLRSSYACENYAKYICDNHDDLCSLNDDNIRYPFMVRLGIVAPRVMLFHCLGSIISKRYILSTWKCRSKHGVYTNVALAGDDDKHTLLEDRTKEELYIIVKAVNAYDSWFGRAKIPELKPDIGLFRTSEDIVFGPYIRPACIHYKFYPYESHGALVGYNTEVQESKPIFVSKYQEILNASSDPGSCQTNLPYDDEVNKDYSRLVEKPGTWGDSPATWLYTFCSGNKNTSKAPCQDIGAPLIEELDQPYCQWLITGLLVSERKNCSHFNYGVFHNVTLFVEAIEKIVWPLPYLDFDFAVPTCGNFNYTYRHDWADRK